jgi:hypothetical protein
MNQPPPTEKQTGKRIVSKAEYAANVGNKLSLFAFGVGVMGLGLVGILNAVSLTILGLGEAIKYHDSDDIKIAAFVFLIVGGMSALIFWAGRKTVRKAKQIDIGVPRTRANTADLPAPESLVRASEEPVQEQEAVLLRAATQTQERHEEQLVRAVEGRE